MCVCVCAREIECGYYRMYRKLCKTLFSLTCFIDYPIDKSGKQADIITHTKTHNKQGNRQQYIFSVWAELPSYSIDILVDIVFRENLNGKILFD